MEVDMSRIGLLTIGAILITFEESKADHPSENRSIYDAPKFKYGTTLNYPAKEDAEARHLEKTPAGIYKGIVERSINLFWGQQEQILEIKIRERRIRQKTKANLREFFKIIQDTDTYTRQQLDGLAEKFWNPREDHPPPMKVESVKFFENVWDKFEKYLNENLLKLDGIESECDEIKDCIRRGRQELPVRFEDIKKMMDRLVIVKRNTKNIPTTKGTTCSEYVVKFKDLRRNDTERGSIQR